MKSKGFDIIRADMDECRQVIEEMSGSWMFPVGKRLSRRMAIRTLRSAESLLDALEDRLSAIPLAKDLLRPEIETKGPDKPVSSRKTKSPRKPKKK